MTGIAIEIEINDIRNSFQDAYLLAWFALNKSAENK